MACSNVADRVMTLSIPLSLYGGKNPIRNLEFKDCCGLGTQSMSFTTVCPGHSQVYARHCLEAHVNCVFFLIPVLELDLNTQPPATRLAPRFLQTVELDDKGLERNHVGTPSTQTPLLTCQRAEHLVTSFSSRPTNMQCPALSACLLGADEGTENTSLSSRKSSYLQTRDVIFKGPNGPNWHLTPTCCQTPCGDTSE